MGADRRHAMRIGATQAEFHAPLDILRRPVGGAVVGGGAARAVEASVSLAGASHGMALVEMRMHVDESRPDMTAGKVDNVQLGVVRYAGRRDRRDALMVDQEIDQQGAVRVGFGAPHRLRQEAGGNARALQPVAAGLGNHQRLESPHRP